MALENHKKYEDTKLKLRLETDVYKKNFNDWVKAWKKNNQVVCWRNAIDAF